MSKIVEVNAEQLAAKILELPDGGTFDIAFDNELLPGELTCWCVFHRYCIPGTDSDCIIFDYLNGGYPRIYDREFAVDSPKYFYDWLNSIITDSSLMWMGKKQTTVFIEED